MMWGHGDRDMTWMGVTMMVLVVVLIVSVVLLLLRLSSSSSRSADVTPAVTAHAALAHRLATGEITVEQYEVIRDALRRGAGS